MSQGPILRPEEVASVLGGSAAAPASPEGPRRYSLRDPIAISAEAEAEGRKRLEIWAAALRSAFVHELGEGVGVEVDGVAQQRVSAALSAVAPPAWVVGLSNARGGGLALALPPGLGLAIVERALGGKAGKTDSIRKPTSIEERVLTRLTGAVASALSAATGEAWSPLSPSIGSVHQTVAAPVETVAVGLLRLKIEESEKAALLLASAATFAARGGIDTPRRAAQVGPLASALGKIRLAVRPVLRAGGITLRELLDLRPGAVFVLDAGENATFDLRVEGRTVFGGRVARRDGGTTFAVLSRRGSSAGESKEDR